MIRQVRSMPWLDGPERSVPGLSMMMVRTGGREGAEGGWRWIDWEA